MRRASSPTLIAKAFGAPSTRNPARTRGDETAAVRAVIDFKAAVASASRGFRPANGQKTRPSTMTSSPLLHLRYHRHAQMVRARFPYPLGHS
jgi:hypothetical protein